MAEVNRIVDWLRGETTRIKTVEPTIERPSNEPSTNTLMSQPNRKGPEMLKMGNRDERDVGFEPQTASLYSGGTGSRPNTGEKTIIGEHISVEGTIRADEDIVIEGNLKGSIVVKSHQLTVGPKGKVEADVEADSVIVSGRMVGNINAKSKVQVTANADFNGQIKAKRIAIEDGAYVKATIEMERDEKEKPQSASSASGRPADSMPGSHGADLGKSPKPEFPKSQVVK